MITKVVLENFMAHERTELELGPGVNALTGPNNAGKSAIVEAIRCVATNPVPKHYIRHGAKEARVTLEFDDGTRVAWVRKKRSSGYELWSPGSDEPEEYWKFGRRPPEDVLKALKLDLVELETGVEIDVHVGNQREPVFLLNQPGSNAAAFFAASTESAHLLAMQNLLKRKTQDAKRDKRGLEDRLVGIESRLDGFDLLPSIGVEIERARELEYSASELQVTMPKLQEQISAMEKCREELRALVETTTILNAAEEVPNLNSIGGLKDCILQQSRLSEALGLARSSARALDSLDSVPDSYPVGSLATICKQLQYVETAMERATKEANVMHALVPVPECVNTKYLSEIIDELIASRSRVMRETRRNEVLRKVAEPPVLDSEERMREILAGICGAKNEIKAAESGLRELETRLRVFEEKIKRRLDELGRCPTCGSNMNSIAFLERGHSDDS